MIGEIGKYLRQIGGALIDRCIALDPGGPGFDGTPDDYRVTPDDCKLVEAIRSSSASTLIMPVNILMNVALGSYHKAGHCDYWVNCGHQQVGCNANINVKGLLEAGQELADADPNKIIAWLFEKACNHMRAPLTFVSSVAKKCDYKTQKCPDCGPGLGLTCTGAGDGIGYPPTTTCTSSQNDDYLLKTTQTGDFCNP